MDRVVYRREMQRALRALPELELRAGSVEDLLLDSGERTVRGVLLADGAVIEAKHVILTTGTFLRGPTPAPSLHGASAAAAFLFF